MSKRMHIYAAAIDPLRKKFGVPAKAVAEKVTEVLNHNGKLMYDITKYKEEIAELKSAAAVYKASHDSVHTELALAQETIVDLQAKLAAEAEVTPMVLGHPDGELGDEDIGNEPQAALSA